MRIPGQSNNFLCFIPVKYFSRQVDEIFSSCAWLKYFCLGWLVKYFWVLWPTVCVVRGWVERGKHWVVTLETSAEQHHQHQHSNTLSTRRRRRRRRQSERESGDTGGDTLSDIAASVCHCWVSDWVGGCSPPSLVTQHVDHQPWNTELRLISWMMMQTDIAESGCYCHLWDTLISSWDCGQSLWTFLFLFVDCTSVLNK